MINLLYADSIYTFNIRCIIHNSNLNLKFKFCIYVVFLAVRVYTLAMYIRFIRKKAISYFHAKQCSFSSFLLLFLFNLFFLFLFLVSKFWTSSLSLLLQLCVKFVNAILSRILDMTLNYISQFMQLPKQSFSFYSPFYVFIFKEVHLSPSRQTHEKCFRTFMEFHPHPSIE